MLKGSIRKRGEKYQVIFPYKDEYGEWKQKSKTCETHSIAKATLKRMNYEVSDALLDNPRMSELRNLWIAEIRLHGSVNTIKAYEKNSQFIIDRLGDVRVNDIERKDVVALYQQIVSEGYEVKAYKACFNMMMNFAIRSKYISANPGAGISIKRTKEQRPAKILSMNERVRMLNDMNGQDIYYLTYLLLRTGLRVGEALGLTWSAVDFENKTLNIKQQLLNNGVLSPKLKTSRSKRVIYLDSETISLLKELRKSPYTTLSLLFDEGNLLRSRLTYNLRSYGLSAHDLRHNHGTDLLSICNIADAATRMGHTVEEYVSTYIHPSDESQKQIADALEDNRFSFCDRFLTEPPSRVIKLSDTNGSAKNYG